VALKMERAFRKQFLNGIEFKNVFIKTSTYEGMYDEGLPNQKLLDHHVNLARGNVALTTLSYGAVSPDGRTFRDQMYIHSKSLVKLAEIAEKVHEAGGKISIQLTHCGYFSKNAEFKRPLAPSMLFNEYGFMSGIIFSKAMSVNDMKKVADEFAEAALKLKNAGFDAVELHMGHGYLLSQFLSPWTNKRKDAYGGRVANRARFPLEVLKNVRDKVGKDFPVLVKLNLSDGFRGGFTIEDCKYVSIELEKQGCSAIVLSGGFTSRTPFYLMRGDVPLREMIRAEKQLQHKAAFAVFGRFIIGKYKFSENFFLPLALKIRQAVKMPLVYLGGVVSAEGVGKVIGQRSYYSCSHHRYKFSSCIVALLFNKDFFCKVGNCPEQEKDCKCACKCRH